MAHSAKRYLTLMEDLEIPGWYRPPLLSAFKEIEKQKQNTNNKNNNNKNVELLCISRGMCSTLNSA